MARRAQVLSPRARARGAWSSWACHNGSVTAVHRYRLRMSRISRALRTVIFVAIALCFVPAVFDASVDLPARLLSVLGIVSSIYGLRIILGAAVEVRPHGLRLLKRWPKRRDIAWYQILEVDIIPGYWMLDIELNSGEQISLPCVERVDDLFERIEELRQRLDA